MKELSPLAISLMVHAALAWAALNTSQYFEFLKPKEEKKQVYTLDFVSMKKPKPIVLKKKPVKRKSTKKKVVAIPKPKSSYKKKPISVTQKQKSPVKVVQGSKGDDKKLKAIPPYDGPKIIEAQSLKQQGGNLPPQYPVVDRIRKNTGTVTVLGFVNKQGQVSNVQVDSSTGTRRMNTSAVMAFKKYRFQKGQEGWVKMPFKYTLDKGEARVLSVRDRHTLEKLNIE